MSLDVMKKSLSLAENLLGHVPEHFLPEDVNLLRRACTFAEKHYGHMTHPTTKPYSEYVFHVAKLLIELDVNAVVVSAAVICLPLSVAKEVFTDIKKEFKDKQELLELIDEVSGMSYFEWGTWLDKAEESGLEERRETLRKMFQLAIGETKSEDKALGLQQVVHFQKKERQVENLIRMFLAAVTDIRALIIKLADRLTFMRLLKNLTPSEKDAIHCIMLAKFTLAAYAPLADRLGLWQLKSGLEDMSFRLLDFNKYKDISSQLAITKQKRDDVVNNVRSMIEELLADYAIEAEVSGRAKHIYSIFKKMEAKQLTLEEINDLVGIRIIVRTREECYDVQEIIHDKWPAVTSFYNGKVGTDWIATPKENSYQSLHTTVLIENRCIEVQIRTREMHEIAEYGSAAAHWRYKDEKAYRKGKTPKETGTKDRIWTEQLAKVRRSLEEGTEPIPPMQERLLKDWVYVITPKGHVIDLAVGATPLDFAYRIHTDLGHSYAGAKVNGRSVRMNYTLQNGDIIDVFTSRTRKGPSPNWLTRRRLDDEEEMPVLAKLLGLDDEEEMPVLAKLLALCIEKKPQPQWLYHSEDVYKRENREDKDKKDSESQIEKNYMYYVFARTRQARNKIHNWLNQGKTEEQVKKSIKFEWYPWVSWDDIKQVGPNRHRLVSIPRESGVYEVRRVDRNSDERLVIGKVDNLESRIRDDLVKGDKTLSAKRQQLLAEVNANTSKLQVRWASTEFHAQLESMLYRKYKKRFGDLPKYADRTQ